MARGSDGWLVASPVPVLHPERIPPADHQREGSVVHSTASGKTGGPQSARSRDSPPGSPGASQQTRRNGDPFPESPHVPGKTEEGQSQGPPPPKKKQSCLFACCFTPLCGRAMGVREEEESGKKKNASRPGGTVHFVVLSLSQSG